jgi:hypothetical protein
MAVIRERGPTTFAEAHGSLGHVVAFKAIWMAVKKADPFPSIYGLRKAMKERRKGDWRLNILAMAPSLNMVAS